MATHPITRRELEPLLREAGLSSPEEMAAARAILDSIAEGLADPLDVVETLLTPDGYERRPVPITEFLDDPYYLGPMKNDLYPVWKRDLVEFFEGDHWLMLLTGAMGTGKTWCANTGMARVLYELSCMTDPARTLGLAARSSIFLVNLSVSELQAKRGAFSTLDSIIAHSPYFQEKFQPQQDIKSELRFPKRITVFPGHANVSGILGLNVLGGLIDEANAMMVSVAGVLAEKAKLSGKAAYDQAQDLFNGMVRRAKGRFLKQSRLPIKIFVLANRKYPGEFTERLENDPDPGIFKRNYALWETKPQDFGTERFYAEVGNMQSASKIWLTRPPEGEVKGELLEVPTELLKDFQDDLEGSIRDYGGRSTVGIATFLHNRVAITEAVDADAKDTGGREHPCSVTTLIRGVGGVHVGELIREALCAAGADGSGRPRWFPGVPRVIHLDPARRQDAYGFVMGCAPSMVAVMRREGDVETLEPAPLLFYDLLLAIRRPPGSEIDFAAARELIKQLRSWGFEIAKVTFDSWQSVDTEQRLRDAGFQAEELSVDKEMNPYLTLKRAFYDRRIRMYRYWPAVIELLHLQLDTRKGKVDHPAVMRDEGGNSIIGSKDVADGMAGVAYTLTEMVRTSVPPAAPTPGDFEQVAPVELSMSQDEYEWLTGRRAGDD